jgi:3-hydroxyisobutyrate dehydrogenase
MGKNIFHAGAHGAGQTAKICNNMLLGIQMAGTAEALALGAASGLDPKVLSDIITGAPAVIGRSRSTIPIPV